MARPFHVALALVLAVLHAACATESPVGEAPSSPEPSPAPPIEGCPPVGLARQDVSDTYVVARVEARRGCDGATWLVGSTLERGGRDVFVSIGSTSCLAGIASEPIFAVLRVRQTAGVFRPPTEACLANDAGRELSTDRSQLGHALYRTEASARAALPPMP